jgi:class 3 adenylate cyclase
MQYLYKYNSFKLNESEEDKDSNKKTDSPKRSERVLNQAQREWKEDDKQVEGNMPAMLFTDVVGSSKMWSEDSISMMKQLEEHHKLVATLAEKNNGWIVKTIGDAFMIYFEPTGDSLLNALKCAKEIVINEKKYNLRMGVCQGYMEEKTYRIQKVNLKDFYGNAVNVASRMESKVAGEAGVIAFSSTKEISESKMGDIARSIGKSELVDLSEIDLRGANIKKAYKIKVK